MKIVLGPLARKVLIPLAVFSVSLVTLAATLEVGLRVVAHAFSQRLFATLREDSGADVNILCLGDSYTVGGRGSFEDSYPKQLERKLNAAGGPTYKVFNGGVCESNSTQVYRRLEKILRLRRVDAVILEVGSANRFNLVGYNLYKDRRERPWEELKVLKMARILHVNIKGLLLRYRAADDVLAGDPSVDEPSSFEGSSDGSLQADMRRVKELGRARELGESEAMLRRSLRRHPDNPELLRMLAELFRSRGRFDEAEVLGKKLIRLQPGRHAHYLLLASVYQARYQYTLSEVKFLPGDELLPIQRHPYAVMSHVEDDAGRAKAEIERLLRKALEVAPDEVDPRFELASFYLGTSRLAEAEALLQDTLARKATGPDASRVYLLLADVYADMKEPEKEGKALEKVRDTAYVAELRLARLEERAGRVANAEKILTRLVQKNPTVWSYYLELANFYNGQKNTPLARQTMVRAIMNCKRSERAVPANLMFPDDEQPPERPDAATRRAMELVRLKPRDFHRYYVLIKAFELQNKYTAHDILDLLRDVLKQDPSLAKNVTYMQYISYFEDRDAWEADLYRWLAHDLDRIAALCKKHGIGLILQDYPYPYHAVNRTLKEAAARNKLLFVENQKMFDSLVAEASWDRYFMDDDHCTAEGHGVMVENVYKALRESGLVPAGGAGGAERS
jgi:tetratricopeptide (TPR) repeat protein